MAECSANACFARLRKHHVVFICACIQCTLVAPQGVLWMTALQTGQSSTQELKRAILDCTAYIVQLLLPMWSSRGTSLVSSASRCSSEYTVIRIQMHSIWVPNRSTKVAFSGRLMSDCFSWCFSNKESSSDSTCNFMYVHKGQRQWDDFLVHLTYNCCARRYLKGLFWG